MLHIHDLGKDFGAKTALASLTCTVAPGETVGLLGPNGAGKTTTMKLLLGMLRPTRGSASFMGLDCTQDTLEVKKLIGYTPDEPSFYDFLSGREVLNFVVEMRDLVRDDVWARLEPMIALLEFGEFVDVSTGTYSHGTKKKLAILVALLHDPKLLLLDEPTNGLDPSTAAHVKSLLRDAAARGTSILVSTHHLDIAEDLCRRLLVIQHGRVLADGTLDDVRRAAGVHAAASLEEAYLQLVRQL